MPLPARIVVATTNRGKLRELAAMLGADTEIVAADVIVPGWHVEETGATFAENARAKALDLAVRAGLPALADDSGLVVDALGGLPGVRSARFAGEPSSDEANVRKVLAELRRLADPARRAAFVCALALAWPDGSVVATEGRCDGTIALAPRGSGGFGYDPIFIDPATGSSFAELPAESKNARSHRARAVAALRAALAPASP